LSLTKIAGFPFEIENRIVHVWVIRTDHATEPVVGEFQLVLDSQERERAARYRFPKAQRSFILSRGALRVLLGRYLNTSPAGIRFTYGANGKPSLADFASLRFNASHSGDFTALALTPDCELGIDVEQIRPLTDLQEIANRFFCPEEALELTSLSPEEQNQAFFLCWTRKEAYVKAIGDGLSAPLNSFRVSLRPDQPARLIHLAKDREAAGAWMVDDLKLAAGYAAALAYRDAERPLHRFPLVEPADLLDLA
jgi:4'-phosphopantetheinyl transferase